MKSCRECQHFTICDATFGDLACQERQRLARGLAVRDANIEASKVTQMVTALDWVYQALERR